MLATFMTDQPLLFIMTVSFLVSLLTNIVTKYLTNQKEMKRLKEEISSIQKEARQAQNKDPKKSMELQKKAMNLNFAYTKHTFKSTFYTFIPLILIFSWLSFSFAFEPAAPGEEISVDIFSPEIQNVSVSGGLTLNSVEEAVVERGFWMWKSPYDVTRINITPREEGEHEIYIFSEDCNSTLPFISSRLLTEKQEPRNIPQEPCTNSEIVINYEPHRVRLIGIDMHWILVFIIFSMIFGSLLKKALKVY